MAASNPLIATLLTMAGERNTITVPRAFVRFTGSLEAAMMLNQLLYWAPRANRAGDAIYKSDKDWQEELCLSRYAVRKAREQLTAMGFLTTEIRRAQGAPTVHYQLDYERLVARWSEWLESDNGLSENEQSDCLKTNNPLSENEQSDYLKSDNEIVRNQTNMNKDYAETTSKTTPPPPTPAEQFGGGGELKSEEPTDTERYLLEQLFSDSAAREFRDLDLAACQRDIKQAYASGQKNGGIIKRWRRAPPKPVPKPIAAVPPEPPPDVLDARDVPKRLLALGTPAWARKSPADDDQRSSA